MTGVDNGLRNQEMVLCFVYLMFGLVFLNMHNFYV
jgi:hypothetical protein